MIILPTSRAVRSAILRDQESDGFLASYITISEFLERVVIVEGYRRMDEDTRTLLLLEACDFKAFNKLNIEKNFFTFIENSRYIFRFFEELSGELVSMDSLSMADTYGDYEEHIEILKELHQRYETLCESKQVLEPIFKSKHYTLNHAYLREQEEILLVIEGYLTNFELEVLESCAKEVTVKLRFFANRFNAKLQEKLKAMGIAVENERNQVINLSTRSIEGSSIVRSGAQVVCEAFTQRLLQVAFVKERVHAFMQEGISPEKIVVVLPDESFAEHLKRFDLKGNFNFAMGESLAHSDFIRNLEAVSDYINDKTVQNSARIDRVGWELVQGLVGHFKAAVEEVDFKSLLTPFLEKEPKAAVIKIVEEELFYFDKLLPTLAKSSVKSALHLFVKRLKSRSLDDVRGGRITVMGVLETRNVQYDGVIVVDFNEGVVPRKSEKDLFLNSATRIKAGLPGSGDREALQKLYYHNLFLRAKQVAIAYVHAADSMPSRFLRELGIERTQRYGEKAWVKLLFESHQRHSSLPEEIVAKHDFTTQALSATALKSFLTCRRKYYHRYVLGLQEHSIERDLPQEHEVGNALHDALKVVYTNQNRYTSKQALAKDIEKALKEASADTVLDHYLQKMWVRRLETFMDNEIERFKDHEVVACEKSLSTEVNGIRIHGQIDRIDRGMEGLEVLDYKSGSYPLYTAKNVDEATDFQLEFYYLLSQKEGHVAKCGYYDLKTGEVVDEVLFERKLELLQEHLDALAQMKEVDFAKTDNIKDCQFCPYTALCGRG